jgi:hypothetical protein
VVALGYVLPPRFALLTGLAILALAAPGALVAVERSAGPASERNFVEHYDSPLVFPLRSLTREAQAGGYLPAGATFLASQPDEAVRPVPGLPVVFGPTGELYCECSAEHPRVLNLFVRYVNKNAGFAAHAPSGIFGPPPESDRIWRAAREARPHCLARLRASCSRVIERIEGGELVAVLGVR